MYSGVSAGPAEVPDASRPPPVLPFSAMICRKFAILAVFCRIWNGRIVRNAHIWSTWKSKNVRCSGQLLVPTVPVEQTPQKESYFLAAFRILVNASTSTCCLRMSPKPLKLEHHWRFPSPPPVGSLKATNSPCTPRWRSSQFHPQCSCSADIRGSGYREFLADLIRSASTSTDTDTATHCTVLTCSDSSKLCSRYV
ncbi:hypothetical protein DENSPDRAFT_581108 [Dentipellis sp. KUC8613]|nr:hypothetical protein DENSPDRAFT_581108 [Dentipellis sp. KUC8613]